MEAGRGGQRGLGRKKKRFAGCCQHCSAWEAVHRCARRQPVALADETLAWARAQMDAREAPRDRAAAAASMRADFADIHAAATSDFGDIPGAATSDFADIPWLATSACGTARSGGPDNRRARKHAGRPVGTSSERTAPPAASVADAHLRRNQSAGTGPVHQQLRSGLDLASG